MWENRHLRDLPRQSVSSSGTPANRDRRFAIFVGKSEGARTVEAMCNGKRASLLFLPRTPPQPRGHRLRHRRPRHTDQRGSARVKAYVLAADAAEVSADVLRSPATLDGATDQPAASDEVGIVHRSSLEAARLRPLKIADKLYYVRFFRKVLRRNGFRDQRVQSECIW